MLPFSPGFLYKVHSPSDLREIMDVFVYGRQDIRAPRKPRNWGRARDTEKRRKENGGAGGFQTNCTTSTWHLGGEAEQAELPVAV